MGRKKEAILHPVAALVVEERWGGPSHTQATVTPAPSSRALRQQPMMKGHNCMQAQMGRLNAGQL